MDLWPEGWTDNPTVVMVVHGNERLFNASISAVLSRTDSQITIGWLGSFFTAPSVCLSDVLFSVVFGRFSAWYLRWMLHVAWQGIKCCHSSSAILGMRCDIDRIFAASSNKFFYKIPKPVVEFRKLKQNKNSRQDVSLKIT